MIRKVLIANRGEIAVRIIRSCRELGIKTVAVYSEADRTSLHVRNADNVCYLGPAPSAESYLSINKILEAAKKSGVDAIHPGYGFLSENAEFARRCRKEGIIFIGPSAHAISAMGDKITARETMIDAGVPIVPGTREPVRNFRVAKENIREIGLPVIIKASAGGGGKGMRLVKYEKDIEPSIRIAKSEALSAFGDDLIYIEKYIESPRHIEFQILADKFGNTFHLCERECSIQRRHQKIVEETPSPLLTPAFRKEMGEAAIRAAKAVNYEGAGTVEFLVDNDMNYYFLEMNTRLQVEHPITERVIGIDLVKEQIRIANGQKLTLTQKNIKQLGHAIECRIYAEDPENNFMPSPGLIKHITEPTGLGIRIDGYVYEGYKIPIYYDPMISKVIVWGSDRKGAVDRMKRALYEYKISGVKTTINFLENIMETPEFVNGKYDTHFVGNNMERLMSDDTKCDMICEDIAIMTAFVDYSRKLKRSHPVTAAQTNEESQWKNFARKNSNRWRL